MRKTVLVIAATLDSPTRQDAGQVRGNGLMEEGTLSMAPLAIPRNTGMMGPREPKQNPSGLPKAGRGPTQPQHRVLEVNQ